MKGRLKSRRLRVVLFEGEGSQPLPDADRFATMQALLEDGHAVTRSTGAGEVAPADKADHLVLGRFGEVPATAETDAGGTLAFVDVGQRDAAGTLEIVKQAVQEQQADAPGGWKPWFPVIDYDRCTNCMQCLTFCLFDVYGVDDEKVIQVQNMDNCKTDCPACSRVCPEAAILFPKYKAGPINGAPVKDSDLQREAMKVDISALLGGDVYGALRERSSAAKKRFSTERDESKALLERKRCLKKLQKDLDIPNEVLMTLPSAGDIEERARRAKEKAERRKHRSQTMQDQRQASPEEWGI